MPMDEADIAAYMASAAVVQNASNLTMADIIQQKIIAMGINMQIRRSLPWVSICRFGTICAVSITVQET